MNTLAVALTTVAVAAWLIALAARDRGAGRQATWVGALALVAVAGWLALVVRAPTEVVQGIVQKIFYVHVANILPCYLGFVLTAVGGIGFLATREERWDRLAVAGAEVGVLFCTLILISGPIWARPVWGVWWVWDLRQTLSLVLWFVYVAYLFLRGLSFGSDQARTLTAIQGIAGTAVIPFVYYAVKLARGAAMHPENPAEQGLPPGMAQAAAAGLIAFLLVFAYLVARRMDLARLEGEALERELLEARA